MSAVMLSISICSNSVHAYHITLIFNSSGAKQFVPGSDSRSRPTSYINLQVKPVTSVPHRKTQIVAYPRHNFPSIINDFRTMCARRKRVMFLCHSKQVSLVILDTNFTLFGPYKTIKKP